MKWDTGHLERTRAKGELAHAVVDGSDGTHAVELSPVRSEALQLKALHDEQFWCSTQANGCGGPLVLAAGQIRIPYFRHHPGAACALAGDNARAARSYEHLRCQRALVAWLTAQGLDATIEHYFGPDGRADIHVMVSGRSHTIEVQLSPISLVEWRRRDENYRRQVDQVTWIYGAGAETAAAAEQATRGHAYNLRAHAEQAQAFEVGVVTDLTDRWSHLDECELRIDRFWTPRLDEALADLATAREVAAAKAAQEAEATRRRAEARARQTAVVHHGPAAETVESTIPDNYGTADWWRTFFPGLAAWTPDQGWHWTDGLTDEGKATAKVLAYVVSRLYASGTVDMLLSADTSSAAEAVAALERGGLVRFYERAGVERWERT
ncbi:MAG: competence protein CoiA family protein [Nocardioides sp.]|uniref:competence protein CoiA n=1 Tax=Nocardioides sp. TaxID=35761 RepID=UPI003265405B